MSKFRKTNTVKDNIQCPKCDNIFFIFRHKPKKVLCPKCSWDHSFHYLDAEGNKITEVPENTNKGTAKVVMDIYGKDVKVLKEKAYRKDSSLKKVICHVVSNINKAVIIHHFKKDESTDFVEVEIGSERKSFFGVDSYINAEVYVMERV